MKLMLVLAFYTNLFSCCSSLSRICTMPGDNSSGSSTSVDSGLPNDTRASTSYRTTKMLDIRYKLKHPRSLSAFITTIKNNIKFAVSRGALIVSTLDSGPNGLGSSPGCGHCFVLMRNLMPSAE